VGVGEVKATIANVDVNDRESEIIRLVVKEGASLLRVGKQFGISRERVRQVLKKYNWEASKDPLRGKSPHTTKKNPSDWERKAYLLRQLLSEDKRKASPNVVRFLLERVCGMPHENCFTQAFSWKSYKESQFSSCCC